MGNIIEIDWHTMWSPSISLLEIVLRGSITYWAIFLMLRLFRRGTGQLGVSDVLLIILIADAAQNSMAGEYKSITEGIVLIGTLVFCDYMIDWLGYHSLGFNKFSQSKPVLLIEEGQMQMQNLKKQLIKEDDMMSILREQGIEDISNVKSCCLEASGNISVIQHFNPGSLPPKKPSAHAV